MAGATRQTYSIQIAESAARALTKLRARDAVSAARISKAIDSLKTTPRPSGARALQGAEGILRIRVGDYRVLYAVQDNVLIVLVIAIGHRREVYR